MTEKYVGINTSYSDFKIENYNEINIKTPISILDYDAVIIDTSWIGHAYLSEKKYQGLPLLSAHDSVCITSDYIRIKKELIEFLESGRHIFIILGCNENCYVYTGETEYSGTGKNARKTNIVQEFDTLSFLPIKVQLEYAIGYKITADCDYPYKDFFSAQKDIIFYSAYFSSEVGIPIAKIHKSNRVLSTVVEYGKGKIVFLPDHKSGDHFETKTAWKKQGILYLNSLFDLKRRLDSPKEYVLPEWTDTIYVPDEMIIKKKIEEAKGKIEEAQKELEESSKAIAEKKKLKLMLSGTGKPLEDIVKYVLSKMNFNILPTEHGRADICAVYNGQPVVCEIKGLAKSASEKNAAQLEKWVSIYYEEHEQQAKPILIINAFKDLPLSDRLEQVFPDQMIPYATSRNHCMVTTTQLLCMYIHTLNEPEKADGIISELLNTIGVYEKYKEYHAYLDIQP